MAWFDDFFSSAAWQRVQAARFPAAHSETQATQLIEFLSLPDGARVLDVPCGTGRVSVPLAEKGMQVTGVDITPASLERAAALAEQQGVTIDFHQQDMRNLPWEGRFDAVLNLWGSFGYFDHAGNMAFLQAAARALKPGGALLIEGPCVEGLIPHWKARDWYTLGEVTVLEERKYAPLSGKVLNTWTILSAEQPPQTHTVETLTYSVSDLRRLLESVGFSAVSVFRNLSGEPYRLGDRMHLVARR